MLRLKLKHPQLISIGFVSLFLLFSLNVVAQINKQTNVSFLKENGLLLLEKMRSSKAEAFALAKEKNWVTFKVNKDGSIMSLQGIDDFGMPIYYITYNNIIAAATTSTSKLYNGGGLGLNLSGSSIPNGKVAIWDGGAILTNHVEFPNSRVEIKDGASTTSTHATHVAGTMVASGVYPAVKGMAFGLPKLLAFDFNSDIAEMSTNASTLLISNHSYGSIAGWRYNDASTRWEFWGSVGANKDYRFGYYNSDAKAWDEICFNAPYYLPVKSAGNNRSENGPNLGEAYFRFDAAGNMIAAGNRPAGISSNNGYDIISTYGNAKNILTVGAVNPLPFGVINSNNISISDFSSWGPTDDGRIKPDLVGDGVGVTSTSDAAINAYTTLSGTSMASPNISGSLVLLQELYQQRNNGFMRSATLKGLVLATATDAGTIGPDYIYGWGLLNSEAAAKAILANGDKSLVTERTLTQNGTATFNVVASGNGPLVATICWTDPDATIVPETNALDNNILRLINDLDIRATEGTKTYLAWILNPALPALAATNGDNVRDNVEQIYLANATPGKSYTFTVSHKGVLQRGPQAYAVIITGIGGTAYCSSGPNSNADSKIANFKLANIDYTPNTTCTTYADFTDQTIEVEKNKTYPFSISLGTCGGNFNKMAKLFIDWNGDGDFIDPDELTATSRMTSGTDTFTGNIAVPNVVIPNNFSRLRIVLSETSDATTVSSCGTYVKGETQDYRIKFLNPSFDVGVKNILTPPSGACANTNQYLTVMLKNFGALDVPNIPITASITEGNNLVATLTATLIGTFAAGTERQFTFTIPFNIEAGKTYVITAKTTLSTDQNAANDQASASIAVNAAPQLSANSSAYFCTTFNAYNLLSEGNTEVYWYKNATGNNPFAFGNSVTTTEAPTTDNSFYAGLNDFKSSVGPVSKSEATLGAGTYLQTTGAVNITTKAAMVLESAKLYIGTSGIIRFSVKNGNGVEVSSVALNVTATRNNTAGSSPLPLANDLNDQGQIYPLNLEFPAAGNYTVNISYENGASIFRNNGGASAIIYPMGSALNMFTITGNNASPAASFYYYFYDIKVKAKGCLGVSRLQVPVSNVAVAQNGVTLVSNFPFNNQWYLNGKKVGKATSKIFTPNESGKYSLENTLSTGCVLKSENFDFVYVLTSTNVDDVNLKVYPVPTSNELNFSFDVVAKNTIKVQLINTLGQVMFNLDKSNYNGRYVDKIDLARVANGVYTLWVIIGEKKYTRKVVVLH